MVPGMLYTIMDFAMNYFAFSSRGVGRLKKLSKSTQNQKGIYILLRASNLLNVLQRMYLNMSENMVGLISSVPPQDPRGEGLEKEHHGERFNPSTLLPLQVHAIKCKCLFGFGSI